LGRVEEQSGNYAKAEEHFRQALKDVREGDEQAARIRLSLGRLLLRERIPGATPRPKAPEKEPEKDAAQTDEKVSSFFPLEGLVAVAVIGQVPQTEDDDSPEGQARLKEAIDLARQLLSAKDKRVQAQGHMLLGEALSRQGQRTEGLREYVKGLEILYPEAQLSKMLDEHPAFSVPDAAQRLNPLLAEKLYGIGLHFFHLKRYAEAEEQFRQAISFFDKDARYYYFLGMAQVAQGSRAKRDAAYHAWEQASRLEANSRPSTREVNAALERIQGNRRTLLDSYRAKSAGTQ
jgi:tetratricopeptide (TPR) repeat protein